MPEQNGQHSADDIFKFISIKNYIGLPLYMLKYAGEQKHIFAFFVILPHWYDTSSWNSSSGKIITYLFYMTNILGADALATQGNFIIRIRQSSVRPFSIMGIHILVRRYIHTDGPPSCQYCADLNQRNIIIIYISTPSEWLISRQKNTWGGNETFKPMLTLLSLRTRSV